jgi:hypothetical protein
MEGITLQVTRDIAVDGNLDTELFNFLKSIPDNILFNLEHSLRTPVGIYAVSTRRVFTAFEKVTDALNNFKDFDTLSNAHLELLESLMAFIDDGYLMMKTLFPASAVQKKITFAHSWLKEIDKTTIEDHQRELEKYRSRLAKIVNKVKHNHARFCHVEMSTIFGKVRGYYIEGINKDGAIIPDTEIHPEYNNQYTAISYNRDIKNYLVYFYFIAGLIARTMHRLINKHHNIKITPSRHNNTQDHLLLEVVKGVSQIKDLFFPDEYAKEFPQVIVHNDTKIELRKPAFKTYVRKLAKYSNGKVMTVMTGDGVSNTWALPYFKG